MPVSVHVVPPSLDSSASLPVSRFAPPSRVRVRSVTSKATTGPSKVKVTLETALLRGSGEIAVMLTVGASSSRAVVAMRSALPSPNWTALAALNATSTGSAPSSAALASLMPTLALPALAKTVPVVESTKLKITSLSSPLVLMRMIAWKVTDPPLPLPRLTSLHSTIRRSLVPSPLTSSNLASTASVPLLAVDQSSHIGAMAACVTCEVRLSLLGLLFADPKVIRPLSDTKS